MIPDVPPGMSIRGMLDYYDKLLTMLENRSQLHEAWYTHKNSGGAFCWICDCFLLSRKLINILSNLEEEKPINILSPPLDSYDISRYRQESEIDGDIDVADTPRSPGDSELSDGDE